MPKLVNVSFAPNREFDLKVAEAELSAYSRDAALRWIDREWHDLGCEPTNPVGKVLLVDQVIGIARDSGEHRFSTDPGWAAQYARAVAAALERDLVSVDVAAGEVR